MALSANKERHVQKPENARIRNMDVAAATTIYAGAIVAADAAGNAIAAPAAQNAEFMGVAVRGYANAGAITTDLPLAVEISQVERFAIVGATDANLGLPAYYVDDETVTVAVPADLTTQVGTILQVLSATSVRVDTAKSIT
jgi:hypothetical protein